MDNIDFCEGKFEICNDCVIDLHNGPHYFKKSELMKENNCEKSCIDDFRRSQCKIIIAITEIEKENKKPKNNASLSFKYV